MHEIEQPVHCRLVPIAEPLIPFFRSFFETMTVDGVWIDAESAKRGIEYFRWQEAMMLCDLGKKLDEQQQNDNKNMCTLVVILSAILTEGADIPLLGSIYTICNQIKNGLLALEGSPERLLSDETIGLLSTWSTYRRSNQIETQNNRLLEMIGGPTEPIPED